MTAPNLSGPPSQRGERLRLARDLAAALAVFGLVCWLALLLLGPRTLKPGLTATRDIAGSEVHRYQARLAAGDWLNVTIDQSVDGEKMDALVLLLGPDGQEIAHADSLDGSRWQEELAAVAEVPGSYLLDVKWSGTGTKAPYRLKVKALGPASPSDRLRAQALRLSQSAADLTNEPGSQDRQIAQRQEALGLWRRLGDREKQAIELYQIGMLHKAQARTGEAIALLSRSIAAWEEVGNQDEQAMVLYELGMAEINRNRPAAASQAFARGLALDAKPETRLSLLQVRGALHTNLGDNDLGIQDLRAALVLARELKQTWAEANILNEMGYAYRSLGRWDDAILHFKQALETARASRETEIEMTAHNSLGGVYSSLGDWKQAIEHYQKALELIRQHDGLRLRYEARILNNLALAHHRSLQIRRALELFQQVLDLEQLDPDTEATVLNNMAFVQLELRHPRKALDLCARSRQLASEDPKWEPGILEAEGIAYLRLGEHALARQRLGRALALNEERKDRFRQASVTLVQGKVARAEGDLDAAIRHASRAVAIVESFRTGVEDDTLRASFLASKRDPYDFYVDTLVELHQARPAADFDAESLRINEMSRARSLLDLLNQAVSPAGREAAPAHSPSPAQARPLRLAEIQSRVLGEDTLLLEYALGDERSYLWAVTPASLHVFTLPSKGAIERIARSFYDQILVRTKDDFTDAEAEQADSRAADLAAELSRIILGPVANAGLLRKESTVLVVSDGALQYIPFSALPLPSSLAAGQSGAPILMVEEHEIVHLPSASVLASLREELDNRQPPARTLALFADPVFTLDDSRIRPPGFLDKLLKPRQAARRRGDVDDELHRLVWSEEEANAILKLVDDPSMVFERRSFDASVAAVTSAPLDQYQYLHFATHGRIDTSRPERSSLVLSLYDEKGERQEHGHLRLPDVYNLRLNADLVVLSACETALGKEMRGEGLIGLTRGFMYAGSRRVLASLWSVDDKVTATLMERFYQGMLKEGRSPAAALRQAQRDMLREELWKSPYYWAGFSLQGEWR